MKNPFKKAAGQQPKQPKQAKPEGLRVGKAEVVEGKIKFYVAKGLGKKSWVLVREIPVAEVEATEINGPQLTVNSKNGQEFFYLKDNPQELLQLSEQVNAILAEQKRTQQAADKTAQQRIELQAAINASLRWLDAGFDVLLALQEKHVDWDRLEGLAGQFGTSLQFKGELLPPLSLDFAKVAGAIKKQASKDASKQAFAILETVYRYFDRLQVNDEASDAQLSVKSAKGVVSAYFLVNDLMLGSVVGDRENKREMDELQQVLGLLADSSPFKVSAEDLLGAIGKLGVEGTVEDVVGDVRELFVGHIGDL
jgi:hypothetical protein